jgi:tyrosyl-tRNA synthetase
VCRSFPLSEVNFPAKAFYLLGTTPLCASSSEARRQIQGGAVKLEGDRLADPNLVFDTPDDLYGKVLQVGKKKFVRLVK